MYSLTKQKNVFEILKESNSTDTSERGRLRYLILSQDLDKLSLYLENMSGMEKKYILSNEKKVFELLNQTKWKTGLKLFSSVIQSWKQ